MPVQVSVIKVVVGVILAVALLVVLGSVVTTFVVMKYIASNQMILDPVDYEIRWNHAEKSDRMLYRYLEEATALYTKSEFQTFITIDPTDGFMKIFTIRKLNKKPGGGHLFKEVGRFTMAQSPREVAVRLKQSEEMP